MLWASCGWEWTLVERANTRPASIDNHHIHHSLVIYIQVFLLAILVNLHIPPRSTHLQNAKVSIWLIGTHAEDVHLADASSYHSSLDDTAGNQFKHPLLPLSLQWISPGSTKTSRTPSRALGRGLVRLIPTMLPSKPNRRLVTFRKLKWNGIFLDAIDSLPSTKLWRLE
jgi:hypothetical protein